MKTMNIRTVIIILVLLSAAFTVAAQENDLNRQVDVSRDYTPDIQRASKLSIAPVMTDTERLEPDINYSIHPTAWVTGFGVEAINPVRLQAVDFENLFPFYLKAGGGLPGLTMLDIYANSTNKGGGSYGAFINHYGRYGKLEMDLGQKHSAARNLNSIGGYARTNFNRLLLRADIGFDYDQWRRYGQYLPFITGDPVSMVAKKQNYKSPKVKVEFGNDFTDLSYFNFRLTADGYYLDDSDNNKETGFKAGLDIGRMFSSHRITMGIGYDFYNGSGRLADYGNSIVKISPAYEIVTESFKLKLGLTYAYDHWEGQNWTSDHRKDRNKSRFLPDFRISFDGVSGHFVPYVSLKGELLQNGYRNMSRRNPYIVLYNNIPYNSVEYTLRGGIRGSFSSAFSYHVYAGAAITNDALFFLTTPGSYDNYTAATFIGVNEKRVTAYTGGLDLQGRISGSFTIDVSAAFNGYSVKDFEKAVGMPQYKGALGLNYSHKDKLRIKASAELLGKRFFAEQFAASSSIPAGVEYIKQSAVVDVSLQAEYFLNRNFGIFLQGNNLANSKLYYFNHYREYGIGIGAGVKLIF